MIHSLHSVAVRNVTALMSSATCRGSVWNLSFTVENLENETRDVVVIAEMVDPDSSRVVGTVLKHVHLEPYEAKRAWTLISLNTLKQKKWNFLSRAMSASPEAGSEPGENCPVCQGTGKIPLYKALFRRARG